MRAPDLSISFEDSVWMVANQSLRQKKTIPNNKEAMTKAEVVEHLQIDPDFMTNYSNDWSVRWDDVRWLYWDNALNTLIGAGGQAEIQILTNQWWEVNRDSLPNWLTLTNEEAGNGDYTFLFTATKNPSHTEERTANISFQVGTKNFTQQVVQYETPLIHDYVNFNISVYQITTGFVTITTNYPLPTLDAVIRYRVKGSTTWIDDDTSAQGQPPKWTIDNLNEGTAYEFQIYLQHATTADLITHYTSNIVEATTSITPVLNVSMTSKTVDADVTSFTFNIESNQSWSITDNQSWITGFSSTSGSNNRTITVYLQQNYEAQRSGTITINSTSAGSRTITVSQRAIQLYAIQLRGQSVQSTGNYRGANSPDGALNNGTLINIYATTTVDNINAGTIFYTNAGANTRINGNDEWFRIGTSSKVVRIDSEGLFISLIDTSQTLTVSPSSMLGQGTGSTTRTITVYSNTDWRVSTNGGFISTNKTNGSGNGSFTATIAANTGTNRPEREGSIRVRTEDYYIDREIPVSQKGTIIPDAINPTYTTAGLSGVTFNLQINTSKSWYVQTPIHNSLTISSSNRSGSGSKSIPVTVKPLVYGNSLTITLKINIGGTLYTCTIMQSGGGGSDS